MRLGVKLAGQAVRGGLEWGRHQDRLDCSRVCIQLIGRTSPVSADAERVWRDAMLVIVIAAVRALAL